MSAVETQAERPGDSEVGVTPPAAASRDRPGRPRTALAFLLAPAVPATLAALILSVLSGSGNGSGWAFLGWFMAFAVVGYLSALLIGVPLYLAVPAQRADDPLAAMLLGGMVAALPWSVAGVLSRTGGGLLVAAGAFGLGCVGGLAFALIRNRRSRTPPGDPIGEDGVAARRYPPYDPTPHSAADESMMVAIRSTKLVHDGWTKLRVARLSGDDGVEFSREIEDHGPAVAVLPYDPERRVALLVTLPRAPALFMGAASDFLEVPAGLREAGEDPAGCARREAEEEVGVRLGALEEAGHTWSMCGISTERMHLFLAPYAAEHRTGRGGGLAVEHENITVVEVPLAELRDRADRNALDDMKTLCLVQTLRLRRSELFG